MNWAELEESVRAYQIAQQETAVALAEQKSRETLGAQAKRLQEREARTSAENARADDILRDFQVAEVFELIRDEKWGEGAIYPFTQSVSTQNDSYRERGLVLQSGPFWIFSVYPDGINWAVQRYTEATKIYVSVYPLDLERPAVLKVSESLVINTRDAEMSSPSLAELMKEEGQSQALRRIQVARMARRGVETTIPVDDDFAKGKFQKDIVERIETMASINGLPGQVRAWGERILDQIPPLKTMPVLSGREVRQWANAVTGKNQVLRRLPMPM